VKLETVLSTIRELARLDAKLDPNLLQTLLETAKQSRAAGEITEADLIEIEAACLNRPPIKSEAKPTRKTGAAKRADGDRGSLMKGDRGSSMKGWTQVRLYGPEGARLVLGVHNDDLGTNPTYSIQRQTANVDHTPILIQTSSMSPYPISGRLDIYPTDANDPEAGSFLEENLVHFEISDQDLRTASSGIAVTKAVVMRFVANTADNGKKIQRVELETLNSSEFPPGTDMVEEAPRHGSVVAILILSRRSRPTRESGDRIKRVPNKPLNRPDDPSDDPSGELPVTGDPDIANDQSTSRPDTNASIPPKAGRGMMRPGVTQIRIHAPEGMDISIAGERLDSTMYGCYYIKHPVAQMRSLPALVQFAPDSEFYTSGELQLYPSNRFAQKLPGFSSYLENHAVEFQISEKDTRSVWEGNEVTKAIVIRDLVVLKDPEQDFELETIDSATFPPGAHVNEIYQEANRRGTVLAMLRLTKRVPPAGTNDPNLSPLGSNDSHKAGQTAPLKRFREFSIEGYIQTVACSADGKLVAVGNFFPADGPDRRNVPVEGWKPTVAVLDGETGKTVAALDLLADVQESEVLTKANRRPVCEVNALAFSPDGNVLAVGTNVGQIKLFRARTGELIRILDDEKGRLADQRTTDPQKPLARAIGDVRSLAFSPDGSLLAACGSSFADAPLVRGATKFVSLEGLHPKALPAGGPGIIDSDPGRLKVWEIETGTLKYELPGMYQARAVTFSPDGNLLACAGNSRTADKIATGVGLWNRHSGEQIRTIATTERGLPFAVAFSPDGQRMAISTIFKELHERTTIHQAIVAEVATGYEFWCNMLPSFGRGVTFSPQGKNVVAIADFNSPAMTAIILMDAETGTRQQRIRTAGSTQKGFRLDFAIAPHGRKLVLGGANDGKSSKVEVWEFDDVEQTAEGSPAKSTTEAPARKSDSVSRQFPLRFKLASDMMDDLRQILLGRPGHESKPSADNQEILVIAPPDVMSRVQTFISVMDWPEEISRGPNFEYPRGSVIEAARSFFYACAIEDDPDAFAKMLSLHVLAELKGDTKSENYNKYLFGGDPDPEWEKTIRGDWPGKKDAIRRFVKEWNRYPLKRLKETGGVAIGFGAKHFCSVSFADAPKEFYEITLSPDRTRGAGDKALYVFNSLPPWWNSTKGTNGTDTGVRKSGATSGDPDGDDDQSPPPPDKQPSNKKLSFAVDVIPEKLQIMIGEPLWLDFKITNHFNEELGLRVRRGWSAEPFVVEAAWDNESLATHNAASLRAADPRDVSYQTMTPESSTSLQLFLPDFHALKKPGEYRITVRRPLQFSHLLRREGDRSWWDNKWETIEVAATATIEVVPADRVRMGNVIEKLRSIVFDPKLGRDHPDIYRANMALQTIDDERTIPVFLDMLKSKKLVDKERACRGLAKYGSDAALEGLKAALQTPLADFDEGNDGYPAAIHECAVQALCQSPHPGRTDVVLALVNHPSKGVRDLVLKHARSLYLQNTKARDVVDQFNATSGDRLRKNNAENVLDGVWELVTPPGTSEKIPEDQQLLLVFEDGWHATYRGRQRISIRPYRVDRKQTPPHIFLAGTDPMRGIYDIKEDGLRLSLAPEAEAFPTMFGTEHAEFKRVTDNRAVDLIVTVHVHSRRMLAQQTNQATLGANEAPLFEQPQDGLKFNFKMNATRAAFDGEVLDGKVHNVVLRIGQGKHFWTSQIKNESSFQVVAEISDKIKLDGGLLGSGLVFSVIQDGTAKSTTNIHIPATGPMPSGRLIFREKSGADRDDREIIFGDLQTEDGKLIPVSIAIDGKT
jgi:WD40 repeat protein